MEFAARADVGEVEGDALDFGGDAREEVEELVDVVADAGAGRAECAVVDDEGERHREEATSARGCGQGGRRRRGAGACLRRGVGAGRIGR